MGFKKDMKRAEAWLGYGDGDLPPPSRGGFKDLTEADAFCWELIQRLNKERLEWKGTVRAWEGAYQGRCREIQELRKVQSNLQQKVEELAAEAAHWKTKAESASPSFQVWKGWDASGITHV